MPQETMHDPSGDGSPGGRALAFILVIVVWKFNSVFFGFDPATGEVKFRTAATTPSAMRAELKRRPVERVVIEKCSPAEWVLDLCVEIIANPCGSKSTTLTKCPSRIQSGVARHQKFGRILFTELDSIHKKRDRIKGLGRIRRKRKVMQCKMLKVGM
jgi:hypothetical protein